MLECILNDSKGRVEYTIVYLTPCSLGPRLAAQLVRLYQTTLLATMAVTSVITASAMVCSFPYTVTSVENGAVLYIIAKFIIKSIYSGTPPMRTPTGRKKVSFIERCPYFRG